MTTTPGYTPNVEEAVERIRKLNEQLIELAKKNGVAWVEAYERVLESTLRLQQQAAAGTKLDWVNTIATTNADFVREVSQAYLNAVRQQLG